MKEEGKEGKLAGKETQESVHAYERSVQGQHVRRPN
jgi:hypothetical protein